MTSYYVKPTGDNGLDGLSEANAWETITYALTQMIANDVLNIAAGAYAEIVAIATEHITLTGAGSGSVTINNLNLCASYPDVSGLTVTSNITGDIPSVTHISLDDVVGTLQTTLIDVTNAAITNCDFTELILPLNGDAAAFTNTIIRCGATYGLYIGVSVGSNITFNNTTILGTNPPNGGIQIPNGTNTVFTDTTFEYPDKAIKILGGATATFIQNNRKVLIGTTGTNTVTATESTLVVADGTYDYRDFIVTPDASIVISETSLWETSGDQNKAWKVEATGDRTVTFRLTDMLVLTDYDLKVDDVFIERATSDAAGVLSFDYTGTFSEKAFTATKTEMPVLVAILKAFRDALVADATLTALVPAANIYAGLRDEKTPIPAIDVFMIPGAEPEKYMGAKVGGMTKVHEAFQISVFHRSEAAALVIADQIMAIMLGDDETLNNAGIKNISLMNMPPSLRDACGSHIPLRFRCSYHITTA